MPSIPEAPSSPTGLASTAIPELQAKYGKNEYVTRRRSRVKSIAVSTVKDPMLLLLVISGCLYFVLGENIEGVMMLVAILLVSAIGVYQELRSARAIRALKEMISPQVIVIRDGHRMTVHSRDLVPGDIMVLEEGSKVPADGTLIVAHDLSVNESILTGESLPVTKSVAEQDHNIYQGTLINSGSCLVMVTATGANTQLARIGRSVDEYNVHKTVLQVQVGKLVSRLGLFGVAAFIIIFVTNYLHYRQLSTSLLFALTLAMSVIPEEIPVAFSSFMALGAYKMSRLGIFSRQPQIIENLGTMDVICLDKTGTITENKMTVHSVYNYKKNTLYAQPENFKQSEQVLFYGMLACEAHPFDAMETAIRDAYFQLNSAARTATIIHEYPLGGTPPMMTHVYDNGGQVIAAAKGAPEKIMQVCNINETDSTQIRQHLTDMGRSGFRILAVASAEHTGALPLNQEDFNWTFQGLLALYDPPKKNAAEVIRDLYTAQVEVKLVTGDFPDTAITIANQIGIRNHATYHTGEEVMKMSDDELKAASGNTNIFARMFPEAKLRLVSRLRADGHIVAMTGDGVNDAPALKMAGIGIAMGKRGTEMARQAADLVMADDNLAGINTAIQEGRRIYQNLRKAIRYIISIHIPIILIASLPAILGWKFPNIFTPIHIIFLELIMGPTCSVFFEKEPVEKTDLPKGPRRSSLPLMNSGEMLISIVQGIVIAAGILFLYYFFMHNGRSLEDTRTVVFTTLLLANIFLTFSVRSYTQTILKTIRYKNSLALPVLILSALFLGVILLSPVARTLFGLSVLHTGMLGLCVVVAGVSVFWFEIFKANLPANELSSKRRRRSDHL